MAAGGEGAPLAPFVDVFLFGSSEKGRIVQNIGGIGNETVISAGAGNEAVFAFDTSPGNMVMDELAKRFTDGALSYDKDGLLAARGCANNELLGLLLEDTYFLRRPPKSTGREVYGAEFAAQLAECGKGLGGRSAAGKVVVFGMRKRHGKVYTVVVENTKTKTLMNEIAIKIKLDSVVYTDAYHRYDALDVSEFHH